MAKVPHGKWHHRALQASAFFFSNKTGRLKRSVMECLAGNVTELLGFEDDEKAILKSFYCEVLRVTFLVRGTSSQAADNSRPLR